MTAIISDRNYSSLHVELPDGQNSPEEIRQAVLRQLADFYDVPVLPEKLEAEVAMRKMVLMQNIRYEGLRTGRYNMFAREEIEARTDAITEEARRDIKTEMLLTDIIKKEKLDVTGEELEAEASAVAARQNMPVEMVKDFMGSDLEMLRKDILVRKAVDFLCAHAVIHQKSGSTC